jgi:hypothetical protein
MRIGADACKHKQLHCLRHCFTAAAHTFFYLYW